MPPIERATNAEAIEALRVRRAELRESMNALELALAAPVPAGAGAWAERVYAALVELSGDFREHVTIAEGPDGIYPGVIGSTPRLSADVARLTRDLVEIGTLLDGLLEEVSGGLAAERVQTVRELGTRLLVRLIQLRQRSADLIYEACQYDIGGES